MVVVDDKDELRARVAERGQLEGPLGDGHWIRPRVSGRRRWLRPRAIDAVVEQARAEAWTDLTFVGPDGAHPPGSRVFHLTEHVPSLIARLAPLTELASLTLVRQPGSGLQFGDTTLWSYTLDAERARALGALRSLTTLNLRGMSVQPEGLRALAALDRLTSLELDVEDSVEDARIIATMSGLTSLALHGQLDLDGVRALEPLTGLASLTLRSCDVDDEVARILATRTRLTSLTLNRNALTADGIRILAGLTGLTTLDLGENLVRLEGARALAAMTSLTSLTLTAGLVPADGVRALAALPSLQTLGLARNYFGDEGAIAAATMTTVAALDLDDCGITDRGARALAALPQLRSLRARGNRIGDEGARALAAVTTLTSLDLFDNDLGPDGMAAVASLVPEVGADLGDSDEDDDRPLPATMLAERIAAHFPGARIEGTTVLTGVGGLTIDCDVRQVQVFDSECVLAAFFGLRGGKLGSTPLTASIGGFGETIEDAITLAASRWGGAFGPVLRAAATGDVPAEVTKLEIALGGRRYHLFVNRFDHAMGLRDGDDAAVIVRDARTRLGGDPWLVSRVIESGTLPALPAVGLLSVFICDMSAGVVEVQVNGREWPPSARVFDEVPPPFEGPTALLRELAVLVPLEPHVAPERDALAATLLAIPRGDDKPPGPWPGWQRHRGTLDAPLSADQLAPIEREPGQLPDDDRAPTTFAPGCPPLASRPEAEQPGFWQRLVGRWRKRR